MTQKIQFVLTVIFMAAGIVLSFHKQWLGGFVTGFFCCLLIMSTIGYHLANTAANRLNKRIRDHYSESVDQNNFED